MYLINDIIVSDALFEDYFQCDLGKCHGACCHEGDFGAPVSAGEIREIEKVLDLVLEKLPPEYRAKINEDGFSTYYEEKDFIGTNLMEDGTCVFLAKNEEGIGLCALESLYYEGKTDWKKPISCELFPIRINKSDIPGFEALNYYEWDICAPACQLGKKNKMPVFRFVKNAIIRKYGEEFYQEMELIFETNVKNKDN